MEKLLQVCCVIDAQGFTVDKVFYPREIAVISDGFKQNVLCNTGLSYKRMTAKDKRANNYVSNNLLGLSLGSVTNKDKPWSYQRGDSVICIMYEKVKTKGKSLVAVKNQQIIPLLEAWHIPYIKLEDYNCPNMYLLKLIYEGKACHFHEREIPNEDLLICAEEKVNYLWKWIIGYIKMN